MNIDYILYDKKTEQIIESQAWDAGYDAMLKSGHSVMLGKADPDNEIIVSGKVASKHDFDVNDYNVILPDGIDTLTINNVPDNALFELDRDSNRVTDGIIEVAIDTPGVYRCRLEHPCYFNKEFTIEAKL